MVYLYSAQAAVQIDLSPKDLGFAELAMLNLGSNAI
jgi:hypothetical protein